LHVFSAKPYSLTAFTVYVPIWLTKTFGIINEYRSLAKSLSILTPSLTVNSFSLRIQIIFGLGFDLIMHSNFASFSFKTFWSLGSVIKTGPLLILSIALFDVLSPNSFVILTE